MPAQLLLIAAINGLLSVAIGAFGAHGLQARLTETGMADTFQTGVHYQMFHTLAIFGIALLVLSGQDSRLLPIAAYLLLAGIVLFSGSLYALSLSGITWLGAITPLGGVAFLAGWGCLIWFALTAFPDHA